MSVNSLIVAGSKWLRYQLNDPMRRLGATVTFVTAILLFSVALNVVLARRVRSVTYARWAGVSNYKLNAGATVPPIAANRLGGQQETVSYQSVDRPTVLYVFTPTCTWCARNMENLKTLVNKESGRYRFVGLSLSAEGLAEYTAKNELKFPIYSGLSTETKQAYKLTGTPQTIVVSPEGKVLQNWMGVYVGDQKTQVEAYFHVSLPGLRSVPSSQLTGGE